MGIFEEHDMVILIWHMFSCLLEKLMPANLRIIAGQHGPPKNV
jgi:hypothetical protein